jgi:hypothetical protein
MEEERGKHVGVYTGKAESQDPTARSKHKLDNLNDLDRVYLLSLATGHRSQHRERLTAICDVISCVFYHKRTKYVSF